MLREAIAGSSVPGHGLPVHLTFLSPGPAVLLLGAADKEGVTGEIIKSTDTPRGRA